MIERLFGLLLRLLVFVLQLVLLFVTGKWVKFGEDAPTAPGPSAGGPDTVRPDTRSRRAGREQASTRERAELVDRVRALEAQQPVEHREWLTHIGQAQKHFLADLEAELKDYGVPVRRRVFVPLTQLGAEDLARIPDTIASTNRVPFQLPPSTYDSFDAYLLALRARAEVFAEDTQLVARLRSQLGLPESRELPVTLHAVPEALALRIAFGSWLRPLLADMLLSLRLGPGYVAWLVREARAHSDVPEQGPWGDDDPPLRLRAEAALQSLVYAEDLDHDFAVLERQIGFMLGREPPLRVQTKLSADSVVVLAFPGWRGLLQTIVEHAFEQGFPGAGGLTLLDFESLVYDRDRATAALQARQVNRERANTEVGDLIGAALDPRREPSLEPAALRLLRERLGGPSTTPRQNRRKVEKKPVHIAAAAAPVGSLRDALRNPQMLRDAVVLGAALGPRRPLRRGGRGPGGPG